MNKTVANESKKKTQTQAKTQKSALQKDSLKKDTIEAQEKKQTQAQTTQPTCPYSSTSSQPNGTQPQHSGAEGSYWSNILPPLLRQGKGQENADVLINLGPLAQLIGTWVSTPQNGYNVMPLPEATAKNHFILKNFSYYEEITFSAIADKVANRGGKFQQNAYTLFYEQRVFFSDGPQKNQLVHAENGSWLHLKTGPQLVGPVGISPLPSPPAPNPIPGQNPAGSIVKQVSVPHGNSILATGGFEIIPGRPCIEAVSTLPTKNGKALPADFYIPYGPNQISNPNVNPNAVLNASLALTPEPVVQTTVIKVDSQPNGSVANIPFETRVICVERFANTMWLELLATGEVQMQYFQNITLKFPQPDGSVIQFPHIVANTLRRIV